MHLVRHGHFPSRDKHAGHTTGSTIPENPMIHANLMALSFIDPELYRDVSLHCGNRIFYLFFAPVTLNLTP